MEKENVFNLIRKFEQLSNEISPAAISRPVVSLKSSNSAEIQAKMNLFTVAPVEKKVESAVKNPTCGWSNNPLSDVENCVRTIKDKINSMTPEDDKSMLMLFMEMMDTLIKLSSIDTDGLKTQKAKKECCLMELRNIKDKIKEWIDPSVEVLECTGNVLQGATAPYVSITGECVVEVADEEEAKPSKPALDLDLESKEKIHSIKYLTEQFSNRNEKQGKLAHNSGLKYARSATIRSNGVKFATCTSYETLITSKPAQICTPKLPSRRPVDISDILSELKYYNEIIVDIDPEDYIRMESIEEYLTEIGPIVKYNAAATKNVHELLRQLDVLKTGQRLNVLEAPVSTPSDNSPLSVIIEVPESTPVSGTDEFVKVSVPQPTEASIPECGNGPKVLEVVIPADADEDEHLRLSKEQLEQYRVLMQSYLINNDESDLIQYEQEITEHFEYLTHFVPHTAILQSLKELTQGYRDLLDLINDAKFKMAYKENIGANNYEIMDSLDKLKIEIARYYSIIETIDLNIPVNVDTLRTNLQDVLEELTELPDIGPEKNEAVADVNKLMAMLDEKLEQSTDI